MEVGVKVDRWNPGRAADGRTMRGVTLSLVDFSLPSAAPWPALCPIRTALREETWLPSSTSFFFSNPYSLCSVNSKSVPWDRYGRDMQRYVQICTDMEGDFTSVNRSDTAQITTDMNREYRHTTKPPTRLQHTFFRAAGRKEFLNESVGQPLHSGFLRGNLVYGEGASECV